MARTALNLYKLTRSDDARDRVDYDDTRAVIVIAANPDDAREMAELSEGGQSPSVWHLSGTTVELVGKARSDAKGGVLLTQGY